MAFVFSVKTKFQPQIVYKQEITFLKNISWNHLFLVHDFFTKNVAFTKSLSIMCESKFAKHNVLWKNEKIALKFRQITHNGTYSKN